LIVSDSSGYPTAEPGGKRKRDGTVIDVRADSKHSKVRKPSKLIKDQQFYGDDDLDNDGLVIVEVCFSISFLVIYT
jgi:hypothetical protein